jgi:hypothetical protein
MNSYDIGDVVILRGRFKNQSGTDVDPAQVRAKTKTPWGQTTIYTYGVDAALIRDNTGQYHLAVEPTITGVWKYRFEGNTTNKGAEEESFFVRDSAFD